MFEVSTKDKIKYCLRRDNLKELKKLHLEHPGLLHFVTDTYCGYHEYTIHAAARKGAIKCLTYLLDKGVNPNVPGNISEEYPIHMAISGGHYDAMCLLLERGAKANSKTCVDHTPLIEVACSRLDEDLKIKMAEKLIEYGANPMAFGMFRKGKYGTKKAGNGFFEEPGIGLSVVYIAQYKGEKKLEKFFRQERAKWKYNHSIKGRVLKGLSILGQLIPKSEKQNPNSPKKLLKTPQNER